MVDDVIVFPAFPQVFLLRNIIDGSANHCLSLLSPFLITLWLFSLVFCLLLDFSCLFLPTFTLLF